MVNLLPIVINLYKVCIHLLFYFGSKPPLCYASTICHQKNRMTKEDLTRITKFWCEGPHYTQGKSLLY